MNLTKQSVFQYPQDFILNFGVHSNQNSRREEYDQTQLASNLPRKYNQGARTTKTHSPRLPSSDIYEAESQWSTKLTGNSFQPSYSPNDSRDLAFKTAGKVNSEKQSDFPEIITVGPEVQDSITVKVSSDDKAVFNAEMTSSGEAAMMETMDFGKKTNVDEITEEEATTIRTMLPVYQEKMGINSETTIRDASTESLMETDLEKTTKKAADPLTARKAGHRRRKVRVRVRPAVEDFVTAESQNYGSPFNSLARDSFKPSRYHHDYVYTTTESYPPTTQKSSEKSILDDFFQEMFKGSDESNGEVTATTLFSDEIWTTTVSPSNYEQESTTWKDIVTDITPVSKPSTILTKVEAQPIEVFRLENRAKPEDKSMTPTEGYPKDESREITTESVTESENISEDTSNPTETSQPKEEETLTYEKKFEKNYKIDENFRNTNSESKDLQFSTDTSKVFQSVEGNLENEMLHPQAYDQDSITSAQDSVKKSVVADNSEDSMMTSSETHPKNHRSEWSEVKYPTDRSLYDFAKYGSWNYKNLTNTVQTKPEKKAKEKDPQELSDYVQAIFDSIKSADEELSAEQNYTYPPNVGSDLTTQDSVADESTQSEVTRTNVSPDFLNTEAVTVSPISETKKSENVKSETLVKSETSVKSGKSEIPSQSEELNAGITKLGKVLRTSTTTKVSHMTEICYRGRCVMTRPRREGHAR